jgi:hypothetical protein
VWGPTGRGQAPDTGVGEGHGCTPAGMARITNPTAKPKHQGEESAADHGASMNAPATLAGSVVVVVVVVGGHTL